MKKYILLCILGIMILFNGCGNKNEATGDKKDEVKQETKQTNQSQDLSSEELKKKEDALKQEANKDDVSKLNELGMTAGMPKDFPADIPQPNNARVIGSLNSSDGTIVTFESTDKINDIVNFYKEEMNKNGYVIEDEGETIVSEKGGLVNWKKDKKEVQIMLGYDKDKSMSSLVITYK
ncbi:MAG: hypothetical protein SGI89_12610 [bacterium]|nr:hypothetical protein [bacterium]